MHDIIQKIRDRYEHIKIHGGSIVLKEREAKALLEKINAPISKRGRRVGYCYDCAASFYMSQGYSRDDLCPEHKRLYDETLCG